jgi:biuret amidohydrolase
MLKKLLQNNPALLVIDIQKDFYNIPDLPEDLQKNLDSVINQSVATIQWAHDNDVPVLYSYESHRASLVDIGKEQKWEGLHGMENTDGYHLIDELQQLVIPKDIHIRAKRRWDVFYQTELELVLRGLKTETLIIIGAIANACVVSTCLGAKFRDFDVVLVKDAVLGSPKGMEALETITKEFAVICKLHELQTSLTR